MKETILTKKERTIVLKLVDDCLPAKAVASDLNKSVHTINNQIKGIYRKMGINCIAQLSKKYYTEKKEAKVIQMFTPQQKAA